MPRTRTALAAALTAAVALPAAWTILAERDARPPAPVGVTHDAPPPVPPAATAPEEAPVTPAITAAPVAPAAPARERFESGLQPMSELAAPPPPLAFAPAPARPPAGTNAARSRSLGVAESRLAQPARPEPAPAPEPIGRDRFANGPENAFRAVRAAPVSTFSIDVDTASYGVVRAALARNVLPPKAAVRTEELINYFPYAYEGPASAAEPFRVTTALFPSPWAEGRQLLHVGIKGYAVQPAERPKANLVFLVDTSGSMSPPNRLPLVKQALAMLLTRLDARDRIAIVAYAGQAGTVLEPTPASERARILAAIEGLTAGGSTAGGEGIRQAYALAQANFDPQAVNRVMLATDGDFNVGITDQEELKGFVERERQKGIFLSVLGFGMGNLNDALMQALAQNGNGAAAHIDTANEARKVLVEEATATLIPIAKDVKIQVEFNPAAVAEYRLIGYETRLLDREDFANDTVDAGEVGSGQTVTALYEIVPAGGPRLLGDLRYGERPGQAAQEATQEAAREIAHVAIRYKRPDSDTSALLDTVVDRTRAAARLEDAPQEARFAAAVAGFGEILRGGRHTGRFTLDDVLRLALSARGEDPYGYRSEFLQLVRAAKTAQALSPQPR
ncbi:vWA domain-containing protein [Methylobacterium oryzisoli]